MSRYLSSTILSSGRPLTRYRRVFFRSGTFSISLPTADVLVKVYGAGGGGGGSVHKSGNGSYTSNGGAGGGGGGFAMGIFRVVEGSYNVVVGSGGDGGSIGPNPTNGGNGGTSSFSNLISATGGGGGAAGSNSPVINGATGPAPGNGGTGTGGTFQATGGRGGRLFNQNYNGSFGDIATGGGAAGTVFGTGGNGGDVTFGGNGSSRSYNGTGGGAIGEGHAIVLNASQAGMNTAPMSGGTALLPKISTLVNMTYSVAPELPIPNFEGKQINGNTKPGAANDGVNLSLLASKIVEYSDLFDDNNCLSSGGRGATSSSDDSATSAGAGGPGGGGGSGIGNTNSTNFGRKYSQTGNWAGQYAGGKGGIFGGGGAGGNGTRTDTPNVYGGCGGDGGQCGGGGGSGGAYNVSINNNDGTVTKYAGNGGDGLVVLEWYA